MTTLKWTIESMSMKPVVGTLTNVVCAASWRLLATDEATTAEYAIMGTASIELDVAAGYTPYENLTENEVLSWVKATMGDEAAAGLEAEVAKRLEAVLVPPVIVMKLPWAK